jgi:ribosomal protein L37AE/L43A
MNPQLKQLLRNRGMRNKNPSEYQSCISYPQEYHCPKCGSGFFTSISKNIHKCDICGEIYNVC